MLGSVMETCGSRVICSSGHGGYAKSKKKKSSVSVRCDGQNMLMECCTFGIKKIENVVVLYRFISILLLARHAKKHVKYFAYIAHTSIVQYSVAW